jgi:hypothetical protein
MLVSLTDVTSRLPTPIPPEEAARVEILIGDAEEIIRDAFAREGRDFDVESQIPWVEHAAARVIRDMVAAAVIIGPNVGDASASSTTGAESDSRTLRTDLPVMVSFGRLILTNAHRKELGLGVSALPSGRFPAPWRWPERRLR